MDNECVEITVGPYGLRSKNDKGNIIVEWSAVSRMMPKLCEAGDRLAYPRAVCGISHVSIVHVQLLIWNEKSENSNKAGDFDREKLRAKYIVAK